MGLQNEAKPMVASTEIVLKHWYWWLICQAECTQFTPTFISPFMSVRFCCELLMFDVEKNKIAKCAGQDIYNGMTTHT